MNTQVVVSNAALVRKMFDAFKQGDIPYILNQLSEDCDWNVMGAPLIPHAGRYIGKGAGLFFTKLDEDFEFTVFDVHNIYEISDTDVISVGHMAVRCRKTGQPAQSPWMMIAKVRNGKVVYFQDYYDTVKLAVALQQSLR